MCTEGSTEEKNDENRHMLAKPGTELVKCGEDKMVIMIVDKIFEMSNGQWGASCLHVGLVALLESCARIRAGAPFLISCSRKKKN